MWIVYLACIALGLAFPPLGITLGAVFLLIGWALRRSEKKQSGRTYSGYSTRSQNRPQNLPPRRVPQHDGIAPGHLWSRGDRQRN